MKREDFYKKVTGKEHECSAHCNSKLDNAATPLLVSGVDQPSVPVKYCEGYVYGRRHEKIKTLTAVSSNPDIHPSIAYLFFVITDDEPFGAAIELFKVVKGVPHAHVVDFERLPKTIRDGFRSPKNHRRIIN